MTWPKLFHRIWLDEEESPRWADFRSRLAELHPDWEIRTWQDSSELTWLRNQDLFDQWYETDPYGRIPDILRYELLWRFGGVYIDTDFEILRPLDALLEDPRPFAAWENERTLCTAILAAPAGHPAIDALITGLPQHAAANEHRTPNYATGPEWATKVWRDREDVRRLPPIAFYPVGWWEKHLLGGPYPEETFAVHHWARGWGDDAPAKPTGNVKVAVLVPWRDGDDDREQAWARTKPNLDALGYPVTLGDTDGDFNRAASVNAAAEAAGAWDVAVIADADTVDSPSSIAEAISAAHEGGGAVVPWDTRWKLNKAASARFSGSSLARFNRSRDLDRTDRTKPRGVPVAKRGGTIVVSRAAWDAVGGFDEGFTDWGHEDRAFRAAVAKLAPGGLSEVAGTSWHLWHPLASIDRRGSAEGRERLSRFLAADSPSDMASLLRSLGIL